MADDTKGILDFVLTDADIKRIKRESRKKRIARGDLTDKERAWVDPGYVPPVAPDLPPNPDTEAARELFAGFDGEEGTELSPMAVGTPEERLQLRRDDLTDWQWWLGSAYNVAQPFNEGLMGMAAAVPEAAGQLISAIPSPVAEWVGGGLRSAAGSMREAAGYDERMTLEGRPAVETPGLVTDLAAGAGSLTGFMGAGALGKAVGLGAKTVAGMAGATVEAQAMYMEAEAAGADERTKWLAFLGGGVIGTSEMFGAATVLSKLDKRSGGAIRDAAMTFVRFGVREGVEEAAQEGGQTFSEKVLAQRILKYATQEDWNELVRASSYSALIGGILGTGVGGGGAVLQDFANVDHARKAAGLIAQDRIERATQFTREDGQKAITPQEAVERHKQGLLKAGVDEEQLTAAAAMPLEDAGAAEDARLERDDEAVPNAALAKLRGTVALLERSGVELPNIQLLDAGDGLPLPAFYEGGQAVIDASNPQGMAGLQADLLAHELTHHKAQAGREVNKELLARAQEEFPLLLEALRVEYLTRWKGGNEEKAGPFDHIEDEAQRLSKEYEEAFALGSELSRPLIEKVMTGKLDEMLAQEPGVAGYFKRSARWALNKLTLGAVKTDKKKRLNNALAGLTKAGLSKVASDSEIMQLALALQGAFQAAGPELVEVMAEQTAGEAVDASMPHPEWDQEGFDAGHPVGNPEKDVPKTAQAPRKNAEGPSTSGEPAQTDEPSRLPEEPVAKRKQKKAREAKKAAKTQESAAGEAEPLKKSDRVTPASPVVAEMPRTKPDMFGETEERKLERKEVKGEKGAQGQLIQDDTGARGQASLLDQEFQRSEAPNAFRVGSMVGAGDIFTTATGRSTTPGPKMGKSAGHNVRKLYTWLIENARAEAEARGDRFSLTLFRGMTHKNLSPSDVDSLGYYLEAAAPVPRPFLRDINAPIREKSKAEQKADRSRAAKTRLEKLRLSVRESESSPFIHWARSLGGIADPYGDLEQFTNKEGDESVRKGLPPGFPRLIRKNGMAADHMLRAMEQEGWIVDEFGVKEENAIDTLRDFIERNPTRDKSTLEAEEEAAASVVQDQYDAEIERLESLGHTREQAEDILAEREATSREGTAPFYDEDGNGRFAAAAPVESDAFRAWFGSSAVVDSDGKPLVVYHGTWSARLNATFPYDAFFTKSASVASSYTRLRGSQVDPDNVKASEDAYDERGRGRVYPVHLSLQNPWDISGVGGGAVFPWSSSKPSASQTPVDEQFFESLGVSEGELARAGAVVWPAFAKIAPINANQALGLLGYYQNDSLFRTGPGLVNSYAESVQGDLKRFLVELGFDGIILDDHAVHSMMEDKEFARTFVAFSPTQIKSALGNRGTFDASDPDIRFAVAGDREVLFQEPNYKTISVEQTGLDPAGAILFEDWISTRQNSEEWSKSRAAIWERKLRALMGKRSVQETIGEAFRGDSNRKVKDMDLAMHVYIDLGTRAEEEFAAFGDALTPKQERIYELSQSLPPKIREIADEIRRENNERGKELHERGLIDAVILDYTARIWKPLEEGKGVGGNAKFTTTSPRFKRRGYSSILQGWANERTLAVPSAIDAQELSRIQTAQVVYDLRLREYGLKAGILSEVQREGDAELQHPNFRKWVHAGQAVPGQVYGPDIRVGEDGNLWRRANIYAPKKLARKLNNALGKIELWPVVEKVVRVQLEIKMLLLYTSLFHHQAFLRSFGFGTPILKSIKELNPVTAYKKGLELIDRHAGEIELLIKNGLTLDAGRDFAELEKSEKTRIGKVIDKVAVVGPVKNALVALRDQQTNFLFNRLGPYLKARAALQEYRHLLHTNRRQLSRGDLTINEVAAISADIANADFGGLNLQREGRNPRTQFWMRILLLAPDWTESNVRSMVRAFTGGTGTPIKQKAARRAYQRMWSRVAVRAGLITVVANAIMAGFDDDKDDPAGKSFFTRYKRAWDEGNLRWLEVDITPAAKWIGAPRESRYYLSVLGHFRDPIKFVAHPFRSAKHKGSPLASAAIEGIMGTDWAGRRYTTTPELLGTDEAGLYQRGGTRSDGTKYKKGDIKGGRMKGQTVTFQGRGGSLEYTQLPSYLLSQGAGVLPIQVQQALGVSMGEIDGFSAITKALGFMTSRTRPLTPDSHISRLETEKKNTKDKAKQKEIADELKLWKTIRTERKKKSQ